MEKWIQTMSRNRPSASESIPVERRRSVVVLRENDKLRLLGDPRGAHLLSDPQAKFVLVPDQPDNPHELVDLLRSQGLLNPGILAIQSPYSTDRYVIADRAMTDFAVQKFLILVNLARVLGATQVSFKSARAYQRDANTKGKGALGRFPFGVSVTHRVEEEIRESLRGDHEFGGGVADIQTARELLKSHNLTGDAKLSSLITLRDGATRLTKQEIVFNGTHEASGNFEVALRIADGLGQAVGVSAEVAHEWQAKVQVEVETLIKF